MRVAVCQLNARDDRAANLAAARDLLERAAAPARTSPSCRSTSTTSAPPPGCHRAGAGRRRVRPVLRRAPPGELGHLGAGRLVPRGRAGRRRAPTTRRWSSTAPARWPRATARSTCTTWRSPAGCPTWSRRPWRPGDAAGGRSTSRAYGSACRSATTCASRSCTGRSPSRAAPQVLVVPAAFMVHTGRDHWEVLLRARAIENQCFVAAAGQIGDHEPGRTCSGAAWWSTRGGRCSPRCRTARGGRRRPRPRPAADDPRRAAQPGQPPPLTPVSPCSSTPSTAKPAIAAAVTSSAVVIRDRPRRASRPTETRTTKTTNAPITSCQNGSRSPEQRVLGEHGHPGAPGGHP